MSPRILIAILMACVVAEGCAGISRYDIHPYYEQATGQEVCCAAVITSGRDVANATVDVTKSPDNSVTLHFTETGVSAAAPIAANGATATAVAGVVSNAVTNATDAALKFYLP